MNYVAQADREVLSSLGSRTRGRAPSLSSRSHERAASLTWFGAAAVSEPLRIMLVAFLVRGLFVWALGAGPSWDGVIYERAAEQLAHGEGYTQRILDLTAPAKPTAFFPPGYAAVLSVLHRVAGGRALDPWLQVLCCTLLVPAAWYLGRRLAGVRAGRIAAWLVALWPGGIVLSASWFTEPLFGVLLCVAVLPLVYARRKERTRALLWAALWLGIAAYVRTTSLVVTPVLGALVGFTLREGAPWQRALRAAQMSALALACSLLPLTPWMVRNHLALGEPVLVSTNGGLNLLLGTLGEGGYGSPDPAQDCPHGMREVDRDRCRRDLALERIMGDPASWLARGVLKVTHTLGHDSAPAQVLAGGLRPGPRSERLVLLSLAACRAYWLALLALATVGLAWAARRLPQRPLFWVLCTPIAAMLALHFVYIGGDRYHAPFVPFMAAFAALCWVRLFPAQASALRRPQETQRAEPQALKPTRRRAVRHASPAIAKSAHARGRSE